mmetsp:Transcript_18219/g.54820  ORF Transcript_18219/g.54820 Transcript_18219/m.54820 type:complete len:276 (+) Transcript_18219:389-1216(+)
MADMAEDQTALELNTALTDDLLLLVLRCLGPHDLHRSAAPVCKRWRALALGELLWRARLPVELASPAGRPPPAVVRWFRVFQKNLLDNPCFLLSQQIMEHPHNMESPWQSRSVDRKTFVWEDDAVPGDPHDVAQVPRPLRPYSDSFLHLFDRTRVHTEGVQRPRAILPPRHWAEVSQAVDLVNALRVGGCGLAEAVRYLDAGAPLRLSVYCGRSSWTTGNRNTFQFEVPRDTKSSLSVLSSPFLEARTPMLLDRSMCTLPYCLYCKSVVVKPSHS